MSSTTSTPTDTGTGGKVLLAYFSRPGENYWNGGRRTLEVGNTEVIAKMIADRVQCDVFRIEAADPYPANYDATVARNVREEQDDTRPRISGTLPSLADYDTVILGTPVWNVQAPMIMSTFGEALDWSGKLVHPFVTYAVSTFGSVVSDYKTRLTGARVSSGLAVKGESATSAARDVEAWIKKIGLPVT